MIHRKSPCYPVIILLVLSAISALGQVGGQPGAYLVTQRWRELIAEHSPLTNPAILTEDNYSTFRLAFAPVLQNSFQLWESGFTLPIGLYQSAGLTMLGENDGNVTTYKSDPATGQLLNEVDNTSTNQNLFFMGTWAWQCWEGLSVGLNLNYAYSSNFGEPLQGIGLDFGATYRLLHSGLFGDHVVGISTQNLIAPSMGSSIVPDLSGSDEQLTRDLKLSLFSHYWEDRIQSSLYFDVKDFLVSAKELAQNTDYSKQIQWTFSYTLGTWIMRMFNLYMQMGFNNEALDYIGFAGGVNIPSVNNGRDLAFIYQYNLMTKDADLDASTHTLYLKVDFGKHREELYARRMARLASMNPNELYNRARKLYSESKYWDAFFVFSRIVVEYPDFFKNDWVKYYRASCQEMLDMRASAVKNYEQTKSEYAVSAVVPYADLGLMRIYYRNKDFEKVASQFIELNKPSVSDSLRYHGAYLMGQTFLQTNEIDKAIQAFASIPEEHPDYVFAQHAIAVSHATRGDDASEIVPALENCIGAKVVTPAQKEMVNRSYVFLGYLFYEENSLSKAVTALRMVPTTSFYAEDALLGQAWTSLKARQWPDCIAASELLTKTTSKVTLQCEGMLLEAYGHVIQKEYTQALQLLQAASEKLKALSPPNEDSLSFHKMQYESNRTAYQFLAENVENISNVGQTATMLTQVDSLHAVQMDFSKKFDDYYAYSNLFQRTSFFARNEDKVREDVEYALATVQKIMGQAGAQKEIQKEQQKVQDKQKDLDEQIDKLKDEMKDLQNQQK